MCNILQRNYYLSLTLSPISHTKEHHICPNCGFETSHNYCAQCGQETHLHNETFWGMVMHFIGHYFHYDSKFWQTVKTLLFSPGKLTLAYWNKQRMRYIPPISLYIFISAVFFLVVIINPHKMLKAHKGEVMMTDVPRPSDDSIVKRRRIEDSVNHGKKSWTEFDEKRDTANLLHYLHIKGEKIEEETGGNLGEYMLDHIYHTIPKVFFFMIPLMAFFLKLLFFRRKDMYFSTHSVFSLHVHSFIFTVLLLSYIPLVKDIPHLTMALICLILVYTSIALHKAYNAGWARAILSGLVLGAVYFIFLIIAVIVDILAIFYFA